MRADEHTNDEDTQLRTNEMNYTLSKTKAKKNYLHMFAWSVSRSHLYFQVYFFFSVFCFSSCVRFGYVWDLSFSFTISISLSLSLCRSFRALRGHSIDYTQTAITTAKWLECWFSLFDTLLLSLLLSICFYPRAIVLA